MAMHQKHVTDSPLVSVVMPVYNVEPYLAQAITSILNQTYNNFELIAVNDGSTDKSAAILDEYAKRDDRLKVFHRTNQGVVAAANFGIEQAKGVFIARQDSDDVSFPKRLEQQVAALLEHPEVELLTGSFEGFDEDDEFIYRDVLAANDEDIRRAMYLRNPIGHGTTMCRAETIRSIGAYGANGDTRGLAEDYELFLRLAERGKFLALEAPMYHWRINRKGLTSTKNKLMVEIMKEHIDALWKRSFPPVIGTKELRRRGNYYLRHYKKRGVSMKYAVLADNAQMGIKMIKYGRPLMGIHQLAAVFMVGRSGVHAVRMRFKYLRQGTSAALRRKIWFGK